MQFVDCMYCRKRHTDRFLCDPAKRLLESMAERGKSFDMPSVEFSEGLPDLNLGSPGDVLLAQLVVKAAKVQDNAGVNHPAIIMTGRAVDGTVLPQWLHANTDAQLRKSARLIHDMTELAIREVS